MNTPRVILLSALALAITGCANTSQQRDDVDQLNNRYTSMESNSRLQQYAPLALQKVEEELEALNGLVEKDAAEAKIDHQVYITEKRMAIAEETANLESASERVKQAEIRRKEVQLQAARSEAQQARAYAEKMRNEAQELKSQVANLKTEQSERGLVLTLDNILFEFDSAKLKPGANRTLEKVSSFLNEYAKRDIRIEGFTDSVGPKDYNEKLSERRADAVEEALLKNGVDKSRIVTEGYGEQFPIAGNDSASGRQQNRRVEIIIGNTEDEPVEERQS